LNIGAQPSLRYGSKIAFAVLFAFVSTQSSCPAADPDTAKTQQSGISSDHLKMSEPSAPHPGTVVLKPGQPVSVGMQAEDICVTDDVNVAREQVAAFPDSPDASFILAVALTRTSMVEQALTEVRRARRLAEKEGGPTYFDKMIKVYEDMLRDYPNDNRLRYGLAWAYYMKVYLLEKYAGVVVSAQTPAVAAAPSAPTQSSIGAASQATSATAPEIGQTGTAASTQPQPAPQPANDWRPLWVSAALAGTTPDGESAETPHASIPQISLSPPKGSLENAPPAVRSQIRAYYQSALSNLDELLKRNPDDVWAIVYRAFLNSEYTGDLKGAMEVWRACQIKYPDNPAVYFFLGEGYLKEGNLKESLQNISRAVALRAIGK
jgi:hypothetical protein